MVGRRGRRQAAVDAARRAASAAARQQRELREHRARMDRDRRTRLASRRPWNRKGLSRRWRRPIQRAEHALASVTEAYGTVQRAAEPGRAFAQAQRHLEETHASVRRAVGRCQDIVLAAAQLAEALEGLPRERADDRGRIQARLQEAEDRLLQHVEVMESAAIAARELVLQSTLTSRDEDALLDINARLRTVSGMLDAEGRDGGVDGV